MNEQDKQGADNRHHSEVPAEGKRSATPTDQGAHAEAPAEGADPDATDEDAEDSEDNSGS